MQWQLGLELFIQLFPMLLFMSQPVPPMPPPGVLAHAHAAVGGPAAVAGGALAADAWVAVGDGDMHKKGM